MFDVHFFHLQPSPALNPSGGIFSADAGHIARIECRTSTFYLLP